MANGKHQIEYLITEATERVAEQGVAAETTDLMLAAFGYLAHEVRRPKQVWEGKKVMAGSVGGGGVLGAGALELIQRMFGGG